MKVWYKRVKEWKSLRLQGLVKGYRVHLIETREDGTWVDYITMDHRQSHPRKPYPHGTWEWPVDGIRMGNGEAPRFNEEEWEEVEEEKLKGPGNINPYFLGRGSKQTLQTLVSMDWFVKVGSNDEGVTGKV